jgi:hypothetical protein
VEARGYFVTGRVAPNRPQQLGASAILSFREYEHHEEAAVSVHESDGYRVGSIGEESVDRFMTVLTKVDRVALVAKPSRSTQTRSVARSPPRCSSFRKMSRIPMGSLLILSAISLTSTLFTSKEVEILSITGTTNSRCGTLFQLFNIAIPVVLLTSAIRDP